MSERCPDGMPPARQRWHPINNPAELGRIQDRLVETLDRPEITDKLGGLALDLLEVAQQLHPVTYNKAGIISADELLASDPNSIPLVGSTKFTSHFKLAPTPVQLGVINKKLASDECGQILIPQLERVLDSKYNSEMMKVDRPSLATCCAVTKYFNLTKDDISHVAGRPFIGMNSTDIEPIDIAVMVHEATHALDHVNSPLLYVCSTKDISATTLTGFKSRLKLVRELRAYAVGDCVEQYLAETHGSMERAMLVSRRVEAIRQEVNGPVTAKDAFAVHDDLVKRLIAAGLGHIYQ
jgi:hypothetical protein